MHQPKSTLIHPCLNMERTYQGNAFTLAICKSLRHSNPITFIGLSSTGHPFAHQQLEFHASTSNFAMLCIFRGSAASRPLAGMRQFSSTLHHHLRPRYLNRWFSQSPQRLDRPRRYTPEQLAAFTNHYAILGLDNEATDEDIRKAYNHLCKRFHPDMMRNTHSKEHRDNPDRPDFVKVSTSSADASRTHKSP